MARVFELNETIRVTISEKEVWLHFKAKDGSSAGICLNSIAESPGIVGKDVLKKVIRELLDDRANTLFDGEKKEKEARCLEEELYECICCKESFWADNEDSLHCEMCDSGPYCDKCFGVHVEGHFWVHETDEDLSRKGED